MSIHEKINYVEYPAKNLEATKAFFQSAFGWAFADYGPDYAAFSDQGIDGGFFRALCQYGTDTLDLMSGDERSREKLHIGSCIARTSKSSSSD